MRAQAEQDSERTAREATQLAADLVASRVTESLTQLETTVSRTAVERSTSGVSAPSSPCNVAFGAVGVFEETRLDIIARDGSVICSSNGPNPPGVSYDLSFWLPAALRGAVIVAPVLDPRTGRASVVSAAPAGDRGVVAAFADLTELGTTLALRYSGLRRLEILVTTADGRTALARSLDPGHWSGRPIDSTTFAMTAGSIRPDLEDIPRIYGEATAGNGSWLVYAGEEQSAVVASADSLLVRHLQVTALGLVAVLLGTLLVYRRVVGPVHTLSRSVGGVTDPASAQPVQVTGPAELAQLAENFNELIATVKTQLDDRQRAEAAARAMLDASLDAVVGMDQGGDIIEWSRQAEATFGWRKADVLGRPLVGLIIPERYRTGIADLEEYRQGVSPPLGKRLELEAVARDGREFPVELSITFAETPADHFFTLFIRDLSARRTSDDQRLALEERLRQSERLEGIGRLAGGIAHDFNNILAVVMNYSQFVEDTLPADSEVRDDVVQIRLAAERGATFTRQLLTFAHRRAVDPQDVHLNTVISELRTMLRRTIPQSVKIDLQLAQDLWTTRIDVGQLEQLLLNLIVNASDAMPDGGTVLVETTNVDLNGSSPTVTAGRYVRIDVIDTGLGMSKEVVARAFEPFFTTKPQGKGTGLGLATAYGIVTQAEGTITIQSVVGKGTTIRVQLPARRGVEAETARIRASSVPAPAVSEAVVFVVEDEIAVRKAVVRILSDGGYSLLQAAGPTSALDLARQWSGPIDLLLTDIVMPDLSGDELARELRKGRPNLRVVYMTGYSGEMDAATLRIDGPVVQKPFTKESLLAVVAGALD